MEIFKLFGSIMVDSAEAQKSISNTGDKADGVASKLGNGIATAGKWGLAIGAAAVGVGAAVGGMVLSVTDSMSEIADSAARAGVAAEEYQKFAYAAKLSGMESETLEKAMVKAQKSFADASTGGKAAGDAFAQLGLDVSSMTSDGAFDAAIMALADMDDVTQRNALANDIFGKSYAELAPLLNEGSAGIAALKEEAVAMGGVMSNESVASAEAFGDTLDTLKTAMGGVFNKIGVELIPMFQSLADWVIAHMPEIQATIGTVFGVIETVVSKVYNVFKDNILPTLKSLWEWVEPQLPEIEAVFKTVFGFISDITNQLWGIFKNNLIPILQALWDFISPTFPLIKEVVKVTFGAIVTTVQTVVTIFEKVTSAIKTAVEWLQFWKSEGGDRSDGGDFSQSRDGSHASGLPFVPYDGYMIEAHRGETLLTADSSQDMASTIINGIAAAMGANQGGGGPSVAKVYLDGREIAQAMFEPMKSVARQRGVSLA